jgi:hypothetical protein
MSMTGIILEDLASTCRQGAEAEGTGRGRCVIRARQATRQRSAWCVCCPAQLAAPLLLLPLLPLPPRQCCTVCCGALLCRYLPCWRGAARLVPAPALRASHDGALPLSLPLLRNAPDSVHCSCVPGLGS